MKYAWLVLACGLIAGCSTAQTKTETILGKDPADLGKTHHPVTTANADAQKQFDRGMALVYAFNHDEAIRTFNKAIALDGNLAMAYWGIALAYGTNYNVPMQPENEPKAYAAIQKAKELGKYASQPERDYIDALAKRYTNDPKPDYAKLDKAYSDAMRELMKKYPDDVDATTLFADSMMVLKPWQLYTKDGKPVPGTDELVAALERALKMDPDHIGANHLYIHAVEASTHPERAMEAAAKLGGLAPGAGHLVHMPSHVYIRTGDYDAAAGSNRIAAEVDRQYIKESKAEGIYPMMYYSHNLHFLAIAECIQGRFDESKKAADQLTAHVGPHVAHMPMLEGFMPTTMMVLARFHKWDGILKTPEPDKKMPVTHALWHFARGMAFASTGKLSEAQAERTAFADEVKAIPADSMYGNLNKTSDVMKVAIGMLDAKMWEAKGDRKAAIELLKKAVEADDALNYTEPPDWILPPREALGALMLKSNDFAGAEKVFRAELDKNQRSGRALFGLMESLKGQGKEYDAKLVKAQYDAAWKKGDRPVELGDL